MAVSTEDVFEGIRAHHGRLGVEGRLGRREWLRDRTCILAGWIQESVT